MAVAALVNVDVIDRVLTLCEVLQGKAGEQGSLESFAMRIHGYLFSTLLAITSHHHPSLQASSFGDWRGVRLSKSQLERVIQQMPLSQSATKLGAVVLWLQACIGSSDLIEELGGALVLCKMLTSAVIENSLQGTYLQQATWVCAALWRLSFHPENAATCLEHATPALLVAMQQTEYAPLSAAALGCVNVVLSGQIEHIGAKFEEYGFADALHMLSGNGGFRESDRITAARTLNNVDEQQREGVDEEEEGAAARDEVVAEQHAVARAAQRNVASCKHLLQLDAPKHVMATCKAAAQPVLEGASEGSNAATAEASLLKRDWFEPADEAFAPREYELLHDAINAALNMSGAKVVQVSLAKHGLWTLVELWYAAQTFKWTGVLGMVGEMASETLTNLAANMSNRNAMYRAELKLKTAAWTGGSLLPKPAPGAGGAAEEKPAEERPAEPPRENRAASRACCSPSRTRASTGRSERVTR